MEAAPSWNIRPTVKVPFVGRRDILDQLQRLYVKGGGAIIFGESGQGKTRLTQEFSSKIAPPARLLLATCRPAESNLPFQPIIELLRNDIYSEEWLELPEVWARQLTLLLPELTSTRSGLQRPVFEPASEIAPGQVRSQILEAIRQVFLAISRERRLLLCLDDAHWSDEATLATVGYLLGRPPFNNRAFFLAAARWEEENPHLQALITSLQQSSRLHVIPLGQLSDPEISELASHVIGFAPSSQLTRLLSDETGGNPFILLESLRSLLEKGTLSDTQVQIPLAQSIQSLIGARLQKVSPLARKVLDAATVIGNDFNSETIRDMTQETPNQIVDALEELEKRQFIEPVAPTSENLTYRLVHEKIRETILLEMSPVRAQLLHHQVAQAMESSRLIADQAAVIAQHYELGGEISIAFKYWIRAGRRARQLFSSADAQSIFSHAGSLIGRASDLSDGEIHDLFSDWTEVAYEVEDVATIQRINADLLNLGKERNSSLLTGTALDGMSDACMASNQYEEGLAYTDQAIPYLKQSGDLYELMDAVNHRGVFLYMLNRVDESIDSFQEALSLGTDSHDLQVWRARANAHYQIAVARLLGGWPETAQIHAQRSLADYSALKRTNGQTTAYSALAIAHYFLGNYPQALQESQLGIELATRTQAWRMLGYLHAYRGMIELALGNVDASVEHAESAIKLGERYDHHEIASAGYRIFGDLCNWLGKPQSSIEYYQLATKGSLDQFLWIDSHFRLGVAQVLCGQVETGKNIVEEVISFSERMGLGIVALLARLSKLYIHRHLNEWQPARLLARQLYQDAQQRSIPTVRLATTNVLGELALQDGDSLTAVECFQGTSIAAAKLFHPWIEIQSLTLLHRALNQANCPEPAPYHQIENLLEQIARTAHKDPFKLGFHEYRQQILQSLE